MFTWFGHLGEIEHPLEFFSQENYIICRGATDLNHLEELFNFYNNNIAQSSQLYLRQSKQWEPNKVTQYGGVSNAFLQPHSYTKGINGEFADKILKVASQENIQQALYELSGINPYSLAQTMFFDQKTTRPHQDWIYLDSKPNGHLVAAWIALEDITEDGIRFFVYPGSQNFTPNTSYQQGAKNLDIFNNFLTEIDQVIATDTYKIYAPTLKKGDIFFWGSRIIHGSIAGENPAKRRRSLAAHFLPQGYKFGNFTQEVPIKFREKYNLSYRWLNYLDKEFLRQNNPNQQSTLMGALKNIVKKAIKRSQKSEVRS